MASEASDRLINIIWVHWRCTCGCISRPTFKLSALKSKGISQINPRTTAKDLVKMLEETGTKVSISTVKRVLYRHNLKGCSARKKPLLQNYHKKPDYGLQLHMGTKIIVMFGGNRGLLASEKTPSQLWSTGVAASCCGGALLQGGTGALHKIDGFMREENDVDILKQHLKTSVFRSVKAWSQMGLPNGQWPQACFQSCGKMA